MQNKNEKETYSIEELVKIGDHIHNCTTAFILADVEENDGHNVLITAKGTTNNIVNMLIETMMKDKRVAELIELSFINYAVKMQEQEANN